MIFDPSDLYYYMLDLFVNNYLKTDRSRVLRIFNEGSARAGKTIDLIHLLVTILRPQSGAGLANQVCLGTLKDALIEIMRTIFLFFVGLEETRRFVNERPKEGLRSGRCKMRSLAIWNTAWALGLKGSHYAYRKQDCPPNKVMGPGHRHVPQRHRFELIMFRGLDYR